MSAAPVGHWTGAVTLPDHDDMRINWGMTGAGLVLALSGCAPAIVIPDEPDLVKESCAMLVEPLRAIDENLAEAREILASGRAEPMTDELAQVRHLYAEAGYNMSGPFLDSIPDRGIRELARSFARARISASEWMGDFTERERYSLFVDVLGVDGAKRSLERGLAERNDGIDAARAELDEACGF